ncbi:MAG TPA: acyl-CoA dehydrogenase family protein [Symbiobacteriaceae bacterium]|nr:acyl-CoA dehydrogenase family protein [Symbiobacteriaceae bacterium]
MNFTLTNEQQDLVRLVREIAREQVAPLAAQIDETESIPADLFGTLREAGLFGLAVPEAYGGAGMGTMGLVLAVEAVAKYCCATGLLLLLTRLPLAPILYAGTEEQKRRYAGGIATGTLRGAFCLSEPGAGSDSAAIATRAVRHGDHYVISGTKNWISGAAHADFFTVAVKTDPAAAHRGISVFVVDRNTAGVTVGKKERKMGVRGLPVNQVLFEEAAVPAANLLGAENQGFQVIMQTLNSVRPVVAARGLGLAQGALAYWLQFARQRETFGKPIAEHQGLQWMAAELAMEIEAARLLTYKAATLVDEGRAGKETAHVLAMAKLKATETAVRAANDCLQMMGAAGYMEDYPLARMVRDARQLTIVEGTSQIQKGIIGRSLLDGALVY